MPAMLQEYNGEVWVVPERGVHIMRWRGDGVSGHPYPVSMDLRLDFLGLVTADLSASLDFYRALGVDVPETAADAPHVEVRLPSGLTLAWDTVETIRSFEPDWETPSGSARIALAFRAPSPAEVDASFTRARPLGTGGTEPWDAPWGQRYARITDPDGNTVDLYADQPAA